MSLSLVAAGVQAQSAGWVIGPIIRGKNYSVGMPLRPTATRGGWSFDFPLKNAGHVHYVTFNPGPLKGASKITVRYRVDAAPGAQFVPQESPGQPATVSVVLQRAGDNWSARGRYEHFRWYAPRQSVQTITPGVHEIAISLSDPGWTSVLGKRMTANAEAFEDVLANTSSVGLAFGSAPARGHGVYSTVPAKFTMLSFRIS